MRELAVRADATTKPKDIRKAMKAALLFVVYSDRDCWEVHDQFDRECGKQYDSKPQADFKCREWWQDTFDYRTEKHRRGW